MKDNQIQDFVTFGRTFENYKWYKPILTAIVGLIIYLVIVTIISYAFFGTFGDDFGAKLSMGYDSMNDFNAQSVYGLLTILSIIPSLFIASKIVKDRPFSSYFTSRGKWDWKIFFKSFLISAAVVLAGILISSFITGFSIGPNKMTAIAFIGFLIMVPLQSIAEEFLFRGFVMQTIGSWTNIPILAVIVQALFFVVGHSYNILGMVAIIINGIVYGYLTMKTNGIEVSSGLHSAKNLVTFYLVFLGLTQIQSKVTILDSIMGVALTIIAGFLVLYISEKYDWFTSHE